MQFVGSMSIRLEVLIMKFVQRVTDHFRRLRHQLGQPVHLGSRKYRLRGYVSNVLAVEDRGGWGNLDS